MTFLFFSFVCAHRCADQQDRLIHDIKGEADYDVVWDILHSDAAIFSTLFARTELSRRQKKRCDFIESRRKSPHLAIPSNSQYSNLGKLW